MRNFTTLFAALLLSGTVALAAIQPQPPRNQPGAPPGQKRGAQPQQPGARPPAQGGVRPPFRHGLPPAPRIEPKGQRAPLGPQVQNWLPPLNPPPFQRGPIWPSIDVYPPQRSPIEIAPLAQVADLNGTWYNSGDPAKPARIVQWRLDGRALFINENGSQAWGTVEGDRVWIPEWSDGFRPGLLGTIRGDRIIWPDGNFWSRTPFGGRLWDR